MKYVCGSKLLEYKNRISQSPLKDKLISSSKACNNFAYYGVYSSS
jgi:hypothetical protein